MLQTLSTKTVNEVYRILSANAFYVLVPSIFVTCLSCAAGRNEVCKTKMTCLANMLLLTEPILKMTQVTHSFHSIGINFVHLTRML